MKIESAPALQSEQSEARHRGAVECATVAPGGETIPGSQNFAAKKRREMRPSSERQRKHEELLKERARIGRHGRGRNFDCAKLSVLLACGNIFHRAQRATPLAPA